MVLNHIYSATQSDGRRRFFNPADVEVRHDGDGAQIYEVATETEGTIRVEHHGIGTMSKSKNNGVDPESLVSRFGADTARLFTMFASPPEQTLEWSDEGIQGTARFIRRLWLAVYEHVSKGRPAQLAVAALSPEQCELRRATHQALQKATDDIGRRRNFNTAIAAMMELLNAVGRFADDSAQGRAVRQEALETATLVLSPIIPHVCHSLWMELGHAGAVVDERWPKVDQGALVQDTVEMVVQVNGKLRSRIRVAVGADEAAVREIALADEHVKKFVGDKPVRKVIVVPGKLVNIVV
jgi:leucyl-tRNA synthetase